MYLASSREIMWEVPNTALDSFFLRFSILPERWIITSCSITSPPIVIEPNSVLSIWGFIIVLLKYLFLMSINGVVYRKESQEKIVYPWDVNPIFRLRSHWQHRLIIFILLSNNYYYLIFFSASRSLLIKRL